MEHAEIFKLASLFYKLAARQKLIGDYSWDLEKLEKLKQSHPVFKALTDDQFKQMLLTIKDDSCIIKKENEESINEESVKYVNEEHIKQNKIIINKDDIKKIIGPEMRVTFQENELPRFKDIKQVRGHPSGLWYAFGTRWADYLHWLGGYSALNNLKYLYVINISSQVLHIETVDELASFTRKYAREITRTNEYKRDRNKVNYTVIKEEVVEINWSKVAEEYAGIEIMPELWSEEMTNLFSWYKMFWSIPSGCIWSPSGLTSVKLLATFEPNNEALHLEHIEGEEV